MKFSQGGRWRRSGAALFLLLACRPPVVPSTPVEDTPPPPETPQHPLEPETPANQGAGDTLELSVPRVEGGALELSSLAGRPYLLTLGEPEGAGWEEAVELFETLHREQGRELGLVLVAAGADPSALDGLIVPWELGWDPQGALAARLEIAGLPTTFVVDARGQVVDVVRGMDPDARDRIREGLGRALGR